MTCGPFCLDLFCIWRSLVRVDGGLSIVGSSPDKFQEAICIFICVGFDVSVLTTNLFFEQRNEVNAADGERADKNCSENRLLALFLYEK